MPSPASPPSTATDGSQMQGGNDTLAASGAFSSPGSLVLTAGADALAAPSRFTATGAIERTPGPDLLAGGVAFTTIASLSALEGADTLAGSGDVPRMGSLAVTEGPDALSSAGWCIIATIGRTEGADTLAAPGAGTTAATVAATEDADSLAAGSIDTATGSFGPTGGADTAAAAGDARVHGAVGAAEGSDALAASASGGHVGIFGRTEAPDALAAAGRFTSTAVLAQTTPGDDRLLTGSVLEYHVYANGGSGAIDYDTPVATTGLLTWTSGVLACGSDWRFGVRCFDPGSGLEEKNLDCSVEIILDTGCTDITNRPAPPFGLRAFAMAGGSVKVEWHFPLTTGPRKPVGFHVYVGTPSVSYASPAATVLYSAGFANTFQATLAGLTDGVVYSIGVRAYNASAEELNSAFVLVTADSTGPSPVVDLTGTAIV